MRLLKYEYYFIKKNYVNSAMICLTLFIGRNVIYTVLKNCYELNFSLYLLQLFIARKSFLIAAVAKIQCTDFQVSCITHPRKRFVSTTPSSISLQNIICWYSGKTNPRARNQYSVPKHLFHLIIITNCETLLPSEAGIPILTALWDLNMN